MKRHRLRIKGPAGRIETVIDDPEGERRGLALIAHPHPLHGGTMDNKVVTTLSKVALAAGQVAVRVNFRGVGASEGGFDHGEGETEDLLAVAAAVAQGYPGLAWTLMGFSFGAYVQHRVAQRLDPRLPARRLILVGPAVSMYDFGAVPIATDIVHGEMDELIPLAAVRAYAETHGYPLHVIPGADHFFHRKLTDLKTEVAALCPH